MGGGGPITIGHHRGSGRKRPRTETRRSTDPAATAPLSRALKFGALATLALRALAAVLPGRWLWGLDLARDLPAPVCWASLLVILVVGWPAASRALARAWPAKGVAHGAIVIASSAALALFVFGHPDETLFTGDTAFRHGDFTTVTNPEAFAPQALSGTAP